MAVLDTRPTTNTSHSTRLGFTLQPLHAASEHWLEAFAQRRMSHIYCAS
ncbi:uncharacterized protein HMPREF1541_04577 [Cyphellophora europaea CBS 101466]|uniref:Uncharacterized protein n=1 Tax=Cyphellophora europaea (strain CBS 101466) TaxID=1220924 RepID=W2RUV5_CYPE1|nr:uncharacterized protein HMPREF1541_04577 [Cyphellophora europaea CBS 101466]ETN40301.1 hypothetical protein HMPREF1541_04577 [Cyphellophora europaea CBS 101466]